MPTSPTNRSLERMLQYVDTGRESQAFAELRSLLQQHTRPTDWEAICVRLTHDAAAALPLNEATANALREAIEDGSSTSLEDFRENDAPGVLNIVSMIDYRGAVATRDSLDARLDYLLFCVGDFVFAAENIAFGTATPNEWSEMAATSRRYLDVLNAVLDSGLDVADEDLDSLELTVRKHQETVRRNDAASEAGKQAWRRFAQWLPEYLR